MAYLFVTAVILLLFGAVVIREMVQQSNRRKAFRQSLYDDFGGLPKRKYTVENVQHIPGYYKRHAVEGQLDDITWNDLNMEEIFKRVNYTLSATGEEYLYYLLRSPGENSERLKHLEQVVQWFGAHPEDRVEIQMHLHELGYTGKHSLYEYIENLDALGERSNLKHHLMNALYLPLLALAPFRLSLSIAGISVLGIYQIMSYFKDKRLMEPYIISFAYIMRLINTCEKISVMQIPACEKEFAGMWECIQKMKGIRRGSFWVFTASDSRTSGNPLEVILDYLRMMFHLDLIIFNRMVKQLRLHVEDADKLIAQAGFLEAAVSVCWFRASLVEGYCVPEFSDTTKGTGTVRAACSHVGLSMEEGYHILLEHPVKNGIKTQKGVLLTGSNASGKSTFLKMTAINAVLAQTLHTCAAKTYRAPFYRIYSSMALRDDLAGGESYYIVEIKSLKRILDAVKEGQNVLCFVDEVLRGTNTVERIAASTQILKSLSGENVLCFAATHDIELAELLKVEYDNYHFEEEIRDGDISFAYRLMEGKATTRNAIRLLELIGYSPEITERALDSARHFVETGMWRA
ncbi:MAG: hypothetical protein IJ794_20145 [Lachnospiraceae bacterium]|nr:hypothetical protein [Lachnospiraceae bacterium]